MTYLATIHHTDADDYEQWAFPIILRNLQKFAELEPEAMSMTFDECGRLIQSGRLSNEQMKALVAALFAVYHKLTEEYHRRFPGQEHHEQT